MTAAEKLLAAGYEDVVIFENYSYDDALIGVTEDGRAVYDFDRMVTWLVETEAFTPEEASSGSNTTRSAPCPIWATTRRSSSIRWRISAEFFTRFPILFPCFSYDFLLYTRISSDIIKLSKIEA